MSVTVFPLHARGVAPGVEEEHLAAALQEQQERRHTAQGAPRFFLDVPISAADVDRWSAAFEQAAERTGAPPSDSNALRSEQEGSFPFYLASELLSMSDSERQRLAHPLAPLPPFHSLRTTRQSMTKVLKHSREWLPYRQKIPLHQQRMQFLDALTKSSVISLVGGTGSGKTLQLPLILSETVALKKSRLILVSPNETAARLTVLRLRQEMGEQGAPQASAVGSVLPLQTDAQSSTSVLVTTADVLLRQLLCDPTLIGVSTVIIDDIHLRSEMTELCLALLRELLIAVNERSPATHPTLNSSLRVIINCTDEEIAQQTNNYFSAVPSTIFSLNAPLPNDPAEFTVSGNATVQPHVFYVDEAVQWIHKCTVEQRSCLIRSPEEELVAYHDKVEVVTQIRSLETDFFDEKKCRQYWCRLLLDAIQHFHTADVEMVLQSSSIQSLSIVVIVVPQLENSVRIVQDELSIYIQQQKEASNDETAPFVLYNLFDREDTGEVLFHEILPRLHEVYRADNPSSRVLLLGSADILQTALPPSVEVGLVIDFARTCTCIFDIETAADHWQTEFASFAQLRHRRRIAECISNREVPPLVIQLIPKKSLHKSRSVTSDAAHHPIFRLSSWRYLHLLQVLQLKEDIAAAASRRGLSPTLLSPSDGPMSSRINSVFSKYFMDLPATTSKKFEQSRRIFQQLEMFLRASGHLAAQKKLSQQTSQSGIRLLQPLGILTCCWLFPIAVSRLLAFGSMLHRPIEATAVAAIWLTGDPFLAHQQSKNPNDDKWAEEVAVAFEARKFFSREHCDVASLFNLYKMWLGLCQNHADTEKAFLNECGVSKTTLQRTLSCQTKLYTFLCRVGLVKQVEEDDVLFHGSVEHQIQHVAEKVVSLPETAFMEDAVQAAVSSSVYPHCGIPMANGVVKLYEGVYNFTSGSRAQCIGVLATDSVMHDPQSLQEVQNTPIVYLARLMSNRSHNTSFGTSSIPVLEQNMRLNQPASVVFCGEEKEIPRQVPNRCRGWSSPLTSVWRKTRRARLLPPSFEIPPVCIPLLPFDALHTKQVAVVVDGQLEYVMRETTANWLRQLRMHVQQSLWCFVSLPKRHGMEGLKERSRILMAMKSEIAEAWLWWCRRKEEGVEWLREERAKRNLEAQTEEESTAPQRLFPFYNFQTTPGMPTKCVLPQSERPHALSGSTGASRLDEENVPAVYTGKLPSEDTDKLIKGCVVSVVQAGSRELEAKLIQEKPDLFSFLDSLNEFHEYYLYLLKQEAPEMEMLGDDEEKLLLFLTEVEMEVRAEMSPEEREAFERLQEQAEVEQQPIHIEEVSAEEAANYGVQEEEAYSLLKKNAPPHPREAVSTQSYQPSALGPPPAPPSVDPTEAPGSREDERQTQMSGVQEDVPNTQELLSLIEQGAPRDVVESTASAPQGNPLSRPPPPLPAEVIEGSAPSILAYPIPKVAGALTALTLALGEALGIRVGPTTMVGKVARIMLKNRQVELRCISMESFQCANQTVYLIKNDRIIDNPNPPAPPSEEFGGVLGGPLHPPGLPPTMPMHMPPMQPFYGGPPPMYNPRPHPGQRGQFRAPPFYNGAPQNPNFPLVMPSPPPPPFLPNPEELLSLTAVPPSKPIGVTSESEDDSDSSSFSSVSSD